MKKSAFAALALAAMLPVVALAQSASNQSTSALLAELQALEQQISALTGASSSASTSSAPVTTALSSSNVGLCPDLSRSLSLGQSGADVAGLQQFLSEEGFFTALVTGYFGTLTQSAVAQWQGEHGIVSGGDAASTGLGVVGPKTRTAMESLCQTVNKPSSSTQSQCIQTLPPSTDCPTSWKPILDAKGCTEYYQCAISLPNGTNSAGASAGAATSSCPLVQKPTCSGTVQTYQTSNGCSAYECVL